MKLIESPYPPVPPLPDMNYHTMTFDLPPGNAHPKDYIIHIDGLTGERRTYDEFYQRVRDCATALSAPRSQGGLGLSYTDTRKDIVVIFSPNSLDYIVLVHAALLCAIPFALIPAKPTQSELVYMLSILRNGGAHVRLRIFVHPSLLKKAISGAKQAGVHLKPEDFIILGERPNRSKYIDFSSIVENVKLRNLPRAPIAKASKDSLAYLMFSSGTSGLPKVVMISHGNLCFSLMQQMVQRVEGAKHISLYKNGVPPPMTWLCFLPFYHTFGLHYSVLKSVIIPTTLVILPQWNLDHALEAIPKYKITSITMVPSIIHQFVHSPKAAKADLSSVYLIGCGAAYLAPDLAEKLKGMLGHLPNGEGAALPEGYGLSEATVSCMHRLQPGQFGMDPDPKSTGSLLPGQVARIVREDGSDADVNEPGELLLRGGNIALGYWGNEKATNDTFLPGGWLRTGDRFRVDEKGRFYFEDRLKDTLKVSGAQVSPAEIEQVLLSHPRGLIDDAAVAGIPGRSTRDERIPRGWVVLSSEGKKIGERESVRLLDLWVQEHLSRYKWLTGGIGIVDEIPKNPTGKVLRRVLVENYIKQGQRLRAKL